MLISVTIPVYNSNEGLTASLNSLLTQTYQDWEAVVVDDGSAISAEGVVTSYNDSRIRFHRFDKNQGRPAARQQTFKMMQGRYTAFLDAGDIYTPGYLQNAYELLVKDPALLGVSQSMLIKFKDLTYMTSYNNVAIDIKGEEFDRISFASTIFKAEICREYVFGTQLRYSQDKQFLTYLSKNFNGDVFTLDSHGYIYNQGSRMKISTTFKKYYYDSVRLFLDGKKLSGIKSFTKGMAMAAVHGIFGYEKLLGMRYKKQE